MASQAYHNILNLLDCSISKIKDGTGRGEAIGAVGFAMKYAVYCSLAKFQISGSTLPYRSLFTYFDLIRR
jgi:hypothetical protein